MSFLRRAATTLGATAIAGGALIFSSGSAEAQGPYSTCDYDPFWGKVVCSIVVDTKAECDDVGAWEMQHGAVDYMCVPRVDGSEYIVWTFWDDDVKPRL